ncbi:MAG TPA: hypothetical protein ENN57_04205 [Chloroflexi bacterium]|nr:hypothetical protein [Chloroflexota bacterium]
MSLLNHVIKVDDIMSSNSKDGVITLGGREFKRVKNGLDEIDVASFIDELIEERDKLAKSHEHAASLTRLAERTVVEADKLAAQVKAEAAEQAKAESAAIIDRAREQARQIAEQKLAEAVAHANEEAKAIKTKAEEEAAQLLENEKSRIRNELSNLVNQQFGYMLEEMDRLKQQAAAVQDKFDKKLSQPGEGYSALTVESEGESHAATVEIEENRAANMEAEKESDTTAVKVAEERDTAAPEIANESDTIVEKEGKALDEHVEPSRARDDTEKSFELSELLQMEERAELGSPQWEIEVLPPFEIAEVMEVVYFLDQLPEVANTEMIVPQIDMPSILVFLRESVDFVDVLRTSPAVAYVEEVIADTDATNGKPKKVRIGFSENSTSKGTK